LHMLRSLVHNREMRAQLQRQDHPGRDTEEGHEHQQYRSIVKTKEKAVLPTVSLINFVKFCWDCASSSLCQI
jgi:hypothetical protein